MDLVLYQVFPDNMLIMINRQANQLKVLPLKVIGQPLQTGHFMPTGRAPGGPDIDHQQLTRFRFERGGSVIEILDSQGAHHLADFDLKWGAGFATGRQYHHRQDDQTQACNGQQIGF